MGGAKDNPSSANLPSFMAPRCVRPNCPELVPAGYEKTSEGWRCAAGYSGVPLTSCVSDEARIEALERR